MTTSTETPTTATFTFQVPESGEGERLDRWLTGNLPQRSRSEIQRWIKEGGVLVDETVGKNNSRLSANQVIQITLPEPKTSTNLLPEPIPLTIIYEDDDILVVDKAAGMVVHPAAGHSGGTLVNAVLYHCPQIEGVGGERRPGIVHRLDKETSGVMVVAKHDRAHRNLQAQFKARTVRKEYFALLEGRIEPPKGRISASIGRHPKDRKRQAILRPDPVSGESKGRSALTEYETIAEYSGPVQSSNSVANFSLVRVNLLTGRTHQIRVHFAWMKHPVVGDTIYGYRRPRLGLERHFLHAQLLSLRLPSTDQVMDFSAPLPFSLQKVLDGLT